MNLIVGFIISIFGILQMIGYQIKVKHERLSMIPIGILSCILGGSISMSGPPVILFLTNKETKKHVFRGNLALYFFLLNLIILPVYISNNLMNLEILKLSMIFVFPLILGIFIGNSLSHKIKDYHFRKVVLFILLLMGLLSIILSIKGFGIL